MFCVVLSVPCGTLGHEVPFGLGMLFLLGSLPCPVEHLVMGSLLNWRHCLVLNKGKGITWCSCCKHCWLSTPIAVLAQEMEPLPAFFVKAPNTLFWAQWGGMR